MSHIDKNIDEQEIIDSIELGEWKQVDNFEQAKSKLELAVRMTSQKDFRINIRVSSRDVTGRLTEKNRS